ncbi:ABC transporter ATP-binding protein [Sporomusa aerivorans]|uniref:ABC transporter ATP-binding protein n=1 Tax=Sporomusa aerivorans TaxID=204936 RepID=UPI00352B3A32
MKYLLEVRQVSKCYGEERILTDVSLGLQSGQSLAITGQSGGGKTTLLSIIGLLQQATYGTVIIAGHDTGGLGPHDLTALRANYFGFVFQRTRLVHSLTALENVMVPAWLTRQGKSAAVRAQELLSRFGMEQRLHYRPQELSIGQLRRVALARALLLRPQVILADEPTNDLDPAIAAEVADSLLEICKEGKGLILVTHDPALAARADVNFYLQQGCLTKQGRI